METLSKDECQRRKEKKEKTTHLFTDLWCHIPQNIWLRFHECQTCHRKCPIRVKIRSIFQRLGPWDKEWSDSRLIRQQNIPINRWEERMWPHLWKGWEGEREGGEGEREREGNRICSLLVLRQIPIAHADLQWGDVTPDQPRPLIQRHTICPSQHYSWWYSWRMKVSPLFSLSRSFSLSFPLSLSFLLSVSPSLPLSLSYSIREDLLWSVRVKGRAADKEFKHDRTQRPPVNRRAVTRPKKDLLREVIWRSDHPAAFAILGIISAFVASFLSVCRPCVQNVDEKRNL